MQFECSERDAGGVSQPADSLLISDNMQARNEMQKQHVPDELKTV